jgi:F-box protein 18 (helicase)
MQSIEALLDSGQKIINVVGVPGAGKTTFAKRISQAYSEKKILYLSFGRENSKKAKKSMPKNVYATSIHSFAKKLMGISSNRIVPKINFKAYGEALESIGIVKQDMNTLESISVLSDMFCTTNYPLTYSYDIILAFHKLFPSMSKPEARALSIVFITYWRALWVDGSVMLVTHDMYLKEASLRSHQIAFDYLIIDEMQDLNDAMLEFTKKISINTHQLQTIRLGDPCQQIFSFRGVSQQFSESTFDLILNESHRFGLSLCTLANSFMGPQELKYFTPILSKSNHTDITPSESLSSLCQRVRLGFRPTIISRFNMTLWCILKGLSKQGITFAINGDWFQELSFLTELYGLSLGNKSQLPQLKWESYRGYKQKATMEGDKSALLACRFIDGIGNGGAMLFELIKEHMVEPSKASVLLTTVHQAKGLEFLHVVMADDFIDCWDHERGVFNKIPDDEAHLIYTAMTRAKLSLSTPKSWG